MISEVRGTIREVIILIVVALVAVWLLPKILKSVFAGTAQAVGSGVSAAVNGVKATVAHASQKVSSGLESIFVHETGYITTAEQRAMEVQNLNRSFVGK